MVHLGVLCLVDGFGVPPEGLDDEALVGGDEEGAGWDVGDDDLELPPDLVGHTQMSPHCHLVDCIVTHRCHRTVTWLTVRSHTDVTAQSPA